MVAACSTLTEVKIWNAASGNEALTLQGHHSQVTSLAYSPDGRRIVAGSYDGTVIIWDASTGQSIRTLDSHASPWVLSAAFSPDDKRIVTGATDGIKVWDSKEGRLLHSLESHAHWVNHLALSSDFVLRTSFHNARMREPPPSLLGQRMARHGQRTKFEGCNDLQESIRLFEVVSAAIYTSIRSTTAHWLWAQALQSIDGPTPGLLRGTRLAHAQDAA